MYNTNSKQYRKGKYIPPQVALVDEETEEDLLVGSVYGSAGGTGSGSGDKDPNRSKWSINIFDGESDPSSKPHVSVFDGDYEFQYEIPE